MQGLELSELVIRWYRYVKLADGSLKRFSFLNQEKTRRHLLPLNVLICNVQLISDRAMSERRNNTARINLKIFMNKFQIMMGRYFVAFA